MFSNSVFFFAAAEALLQAPHKWILDEATGNFIDTGAVGGFDATRDGTIAMITPGLNSEARSPSFTPNSGANMGDVLGGDTSGTDAAFSVKLYIKLDALPGAYGQIIGKHSDATASKVSWTILVRSNGDVDLITYFTNTAPLAFRVVRVTGMLAAGVESRLTMTFDGSIDTNDGLDRVKFYKDGVEQTTALFSSTGSLSDIIPTTAKFAVGCMINSDDTRKSGIDGQVGSVEFFDFVLDGADA